MPAEWPAESWTLSGVCLPHVPPINKTVYNHRPEGSGSALSPGGGAWAGAGLGQGRGLGPEGSILRLMDESQPQTEFWGGGYGNVES